MKIFKHRGSGQQFMIFSLPSLPHTVASNNKNAINNEIQLMALINDCCIGSIKCIAAFGLMRFYFLLMLQLSETYEDQLYGANNNNGNYFQLKPRTRNLTDTYFNQ